MTYTRGIFILPVQDIPDAEKYRVLCEDNRSAKSNQGIVHILHTHKCKNTSIGKQRHTVLHVNMDKTKGLFVFEVQDRSPGLKSFF